MGQKGSEGRGIEGKGKGEEERASLDASFTRKFKMATVNDINVILTTAAMFSGTPNPLPTASTVDTVRLWRTPSCINRK